MPIGTSKRERTSSPHCCWLLLLASTLLANHVVHSYPMLLEVEEDVTRCIKYSVPERDDANVAFIAIPSSAANEDYAEDYPDWPDKQQKLESYYMEQMAQLGKKRLENGYLPGRFNDRIPADMKKIEDDFIAEFEGERKSGLSIRITNPNNGQTRSLQSFWFIPLVFNELRKLTGADLPGQDNPLEGFEFCLENNNEDGVPVDVILEAVLASEEPEEEVNDEGVPIFESAHLTPLTEQLSQSISSAQKVIREMNYLERRETRMRMTADSINARVRNFSYISVSILLIVTYIQVTYLKRYFKKKKLL